MDVLVTTVISFFLTQRQAGRTCAEWVITPELYSGSTIHLPTGNKWCRWLAWDRLCEGKGLMEKTTIYTGRSWRVERGRANEQPWNFTVSYRVITYLKLRNRTQWNLSVNPIFTSVTFWNPDRYFSILACLMVNCHSLLSRPPQHVTKL